MDNQTHIHYHFDAQSAKPKPPKLPKLFVAVNINPYSQLNTIKYSVDGNNWSNIISGGFDDNYGLGIAYGKNTWVAYGSSTNSNNSIQYSTTGSNWNSSITGGFYNDVYSIAYGKNMWIAIGSNDVGGGSTIKTSGNGSNWSNAITNLGNVGEHSKIIYGKNNWLLFNSEQNLSSIIKYSTDGSNWIPSYIGLVKKPTSISYASMVINNKLSNRWIAYHPLITQYSINGTTWYHNMTDKIFSESVHN